VERLAQDVMRALVRW